MATRQYIGARYVPKFYTNSVDGSTQWESNVVYDPLIFVTLTNGHMYISKKQVPATVGSPASNVEYWLDMGSYNGFIESLQEQIDLLDSNIGQLSNLKDTLDKTDVVSAINSVGKRKFIFLADSYGTFHKDDDNYNYIQFACASCGLVENTDYYQFYRSGTGFCADAPHEFTTLLQDNDTEIDKDSITDIVVLGSANDQLGTYNTIRAGISRFYNYTHTNYPNAKIHIGSISKSLETAALISKLRTVSQAYKDASDYGFIYMCNSEYIMTWLNMFRGDALHPTQNAILELARYLAMWIKSGNISVNRTLAANNLISYANSSFLQERAGSSQPIITMKQDNGAITAGCGGSGIMAFCSMKAAKTLNVGTTVINNELEIVDSLFYPVNNNCTCWYGSLWAGNDRYGAILVIKPDDIATNNQKFKCDLIIENTTGTSVTLEQNTNVSLIFPQPLPQTL